MIRTKSIRPALLLATLATVRPADGQGPSSPSQPIPVEFMAGMRYASANLALSRSLSGGSRFGFIHVSTVVMDYDGGADDNLALQNLLFFEPVERFRLTAGLFYGSEPGVSPTAGAQYVDSGPGWFVLLSPRVNLENGRSYSVFAVARRTIGLREGLGLYASLQALNTFDAGGHVKSYQWARLGLEAGGTQLGLGLNLDETGPDPDVEYSVGIFLRRELF